MDKCYKFTALLLVYLVTVVDSKSSFNYDTSEGMEKQSLTIADIRVELFSSDLSDKSSTTRDQCDVILEKPIITQDSEASCPISCLDWSECSSSGEQYKHRSLICSKNQLQCVLPSNGSPFERKNCTFNPGNWSAWSNWSECSSSGEQYRNRSLICSQNQPQCLLPSNDSPFERKNCTFNPGNWSAWSNWSECSSSGEQYRHRSLICSKNQPQCLLPSNDSPFERKNCTFNPDASAQGSRKENIKEDEKCYTLSEIILVGFGCFLMGVILTALLFILYMKRTQQGCFSNNIMESQGDSRQQCSPDFQFQSRKAVVKKYDPKKPESADSKYENKSEETQYQSLNSNPIDNDQQTYDELELKEPRSDHHGNEIRSGRLKHTGKQTDHMTNKTEGVNDNARDSDLGGHNYFILENENISQESKAINLRRQETCYVVGDEVRDSNLGTQDEQSDAAHVYFVLEHVENGHNQN